MEFKFDINNLLPCAITKLDNRSVPSGLHGFGHSYDTDRQKKSQLIEVIDKLGAASAKAQGLHGPITSCQKLGLSDHRLYVLTDSEANNGYGAAVGLLKAGRKKLFIYDRDGNHHEAEPLCVLDFYVHESRQRKGCGKQLFQHMLQVEGIKPHHLAVDRPSHKFLAFLQKHYHLKASIPQVNNFVVFDSFFRDKPPDLRKKPGGRPPAHPYSRQGLGHDIDTRSQTDSRQEHQRTPSALSTGRLKSDETFEHDMTDLVSALSLSGWDDEPDEGEQSRGSVGGVTLPPVPHTNNHRDASNGKSYNTQNRSPEKGRLGARLNMYSRHTLTDTPPPAAAVNTRDKHHTTQQNSPEKSYRPSSPPLLNRDGPSRDFVQLKHRVPSSEYLDRRGHLKIGALGPPATFKSPENSPPKKESSSPYKARPGLPPGDPYTTKSARPDGINTGWNVFGLPPGGQANGANKKLGHTKLW